MRQLFLEGNNQKMVFSFRHCISEKKHCILGLSKELILKLYRKLGLYEDKTMPEIHQLCREE